MSPCASPAATLQAEKLTPNRTSGKSGSKATVLPVGGSRDECRSGTQSSKGISFFLPPLLGGGAAVPAAIVCLRHERLPGRSAMGGRMSLTLKAPEVVAAACDWEPLYSTNEDAFWRRASEENHENEQITKQNAEINAERRRCGGSFGAGTVLRDFGPSMVDLMVMDDHDAAGGYALVVLAGENAGAVALPLPSAARPSPVIGVSVNWMIENRAFWLPPSSALHAVLVSWRYRAVWDPRMAPWPARAQGCDLIVDDEPRPVPTEPCVPLPSGAVPAAACAWERLMETGIGALSRGAILRLPYAFEGTQDLLVVEEPRSHSGLSLIVATGSKAGRVRQYLPDEALAMQGAISIAWLRANWAEWIDEDFGPEHVWVARGYQLGDMRWKGEDGASLSCPVAIRPWRHTPWAERSP